SPSVPPPVPSSPTRRSSDLTALFEHLTVRESLQLYASFYGISRDFEPLLDSFDLKEKERTLVKHLSGGQRQRLAIALAVVHDPRSEEHTSELQSRENIVCRL